MKSLGTVSHEIVEATILSLSRKAINCDLSFVADEDIKKPSLPGAIGGEGEHRKFGIQSLPTSSS